MYHINEKPELIIGLVAPVGVDLDTIEQNLMDYLRHFSYTANVIHLSKLIKNIEGLETELSEESEFARINTYMTAGDEARDKAERGDILSLLAVNEIYSSREQKQPVLNSTAHILRSLKHPDEVELLRNVYGEGFYLVSVFSSWTKRLEYFERKNISKADAEYLINRDESEEFDLGQQTREVFHLADVFIDADKPNLGEQISRCLDIIFGYPYYTPTKDEYAMYLAFAASVRSGDLARQVGAVISSSDGEIIATGANDVPCFGGGLYWIDHAEKDNRDYKKGVDTNTAYKNEIILELMEKIYKGFENEEELLKRGKKYLKNTKLFDITEFGRAVHAEMEALLSCSRKGVSPTGGTLYCTTFPCHNCAKHIIASGIKRVVFVEPYPKSQAKALHGDELVIVHEENVENFDDKVRFEPFVGFGPRKFMDVFSMNLSRGYKLKRKKEGKIVEWEREKSAVRVPLLPLSYLDREELIVKEINVQIKGGNYEDQKK